MHFSFQKLNFFFQRKKDMHLSKMIIYQKLEYIFALD